MSTTESWAAVGRRLGAPGVTTMSDPGFSRTLLFAFLVGLAWAQGGAWRTLAGLLLLAYIARPGPDGRSLLTTVVDGAQALVGEVLR